MAEDLDYRRSSFSGNGANCVEAAGYDTGVSVRDSKDPAGPTIELTHRQWMLFVERL